MSLFLEPSTVGTYSQEPATVGGKGHATMLKLKAIAQASTGNPMGVLNLVSGEVKHVMAAKDKKAAFMDIADSLGVKNAKPPAGRGKLF